MNSTIRNVAVVSVALLSLACGGGSASGPAAEVEKPAEQSPAAAPSPAAPGTPEAALEETKKVATATLTSLVNAAATPELKEALGAGLKLIEKMPTADAVATFEAVYKESAANLEEVKVANQLGSVFELKVDPSAPDLDMSVPSLGLTADALLSAANRNVLIGNVVDALKAFMKLKGQSVGSSYQLSFKAQSLVNATCFLDPSFTRYENDVAIGCSNPSANVIVANLLFFHYKSELNDYIIAEDLEWVDADRALRMLAEMAQVVYVAAVNGQTINMFTLLPETTKKIRDPKPISVQTTALPGEMVAQLNGANDLAIKAVGTAEFAKKVNYGGKYAVTVLTPPSGATCTVTGGTGRARAAVTAIVACRAPEWAVGGTVSGLPSGGSVALQLNAANDLTVSANGSFKFTATVQSNYAVTVKTPPPGHVCTVTNGTGMASADITNVAVSCVVVTKEVSVSVTGMTSGVLKLKLNDANPINVDANGTFTFAPKLNVGSQYAVTVQENPVGKSCNVTAGSGTIENDVAIAVNCVTLKYTVGGNVTGKGNNGNIVLRLNGANDKTISANGAFTFTTPEINYGADYAVTVASQPAHHNCIVTSGTGAIAGAVTNVSVACTASEFTLKANVTGLTGGTLTLQNNFSPSLPITAVGLHTFSSKISANDSYSYDVRIIGQPAGQTCAFVGSAGGLASADVTVTVNCVATPVTYTVGGAVNGLSFGHTVELRLTYGASDTTEDLSVEGPIMPGAAPFDFLAGLSNGDAYTVEILTQPGMGVTCSVTSGDSGTIASADVTDVAVTCN